MVQTVDTDLNQAVKARYQAREVAAMIRLMRDGVAVPYLRLAECVDLMVDVLSDMDLHHAAAEGSIKTGLRVSLANSSQDHLIVTAAASFWNELNMREKVNAAVAEVRAGVQVVRLRWCVNDIRRLIRSYPPHQHVDTILAALGEDTALEDGEKPYEEADQGSDAGAASDPSQWSDAEDYREQDWRASVEAFVSSLGASRG